MAQFSRIQRGTATIAGNSLTVDVSISAVDPSKCLVFHSSRNTVHIVSKNFQLVAGVYHTFPNNTTIRFGRSDNTDGVGTQIPIIIEYQIVEFSSGIKVQRASDFSTEYGSTTISFTSAVDVNKSWVRVYETGSGPNWAFNGYDEYIAKLKDSTSFDVYNWRDASNYPTTFLWEVVEYDNCTVQYVSASLPSGFGTNSYGLIGNLTSAVDPNKTLIIPSYIIKTGVNNLNHLPVCVLSGTDKVIWKRSGTSNETVSEDIGCYVIEFTDNKVYQHSASIGSNTTVVDNISVDGWNFNKSVSFLNSIFNKIPYGTNNDVVFSAHQITHKLTSDGTFSASRGGTLGTVLLDYQVIEFGAFESIPPIYYFSATSAIICSGSSATLYWSVDSNNTSSTIENVDNYISIITSSTNTTSNQTSATFSNIQIGSGSNRMFVVLYGNEDSIGSGYPISMNYGGKNLSLAVSSTVSDGTASNSFSIWYMPCELSGVPSSGDSKTLTIVHNQTVDAGISIVPITLENCSQKNPYSSSAVTATNVQSVSNSFTNVKAKDIIIQSYGTGQEIVPLEPRSNQIEFADFSATSMRHGSSYFTAVSAGSFNLSVGLQGVGIGGLTQRFVSVGTVFERFDGSVQSSGSLVVTPSATTEYVLSTRYIGNNVSNKSSVVIFVNTYPRVTNFSCLSTSIAVGQNSTLNWEVANVDCWCSSAASVTSAIVVTSGTTSAWSTFDRQYRKLIEIQTSALSGSSTGFPLYFDLRNLNTDSNFWSNVNVDGGDLIVATSADVRLPLEIVWISATLSAGEIYFKTDNELTATNKFYLYWGKTGASQPVVTDTYGRNAVWNNGYKRVWHFQNGVSGVASLVDSTGNVSALVPNVNSTYMAECPIQGQNFSATSNNYANAYETTGIKTSDLSATATIECLIKHASTYTTGATERRHIISHQTGLDWAFFFDTNGRIWFEQDNTAGGWSVIDTDKNSWTGGEWYDIGFTLVSTSSNSHTGIFYVSGVQESTQVSTDQWLSQSTNYAIGNHGAGGAAILDNMAIADLRISNVVRNSAWMKTSNNMKMRNSQFWKTNSTQVNTSAYTTSSTVYSYEGATSAWNTFDREYRITISAGSMISSAETNVPMYYDLANLSGINSFWSNVNADGGDLIITSSDGSTRLPLEVVFVNTNNKTGEIYFKDTGALKTSASAQKNIYYLYWGKTGATQPTVTDTYGRNNVWNSNYIAVYHMQDLSESTGKGASNLTRVGADQTSASYYNFNGIGNYMPFSGVSFSSLQNMTFENFIYVDSTGNVPGCLLRARNNGAGIPATGPGIRDNNQIEYHWADQANTYGYDPNKTVPSNRWFFYGWRISSNAGICRVSGTDTTNAVTHNAITCTTAVEWRIGDDPTQNRFFKGYIGEVRLMSATASEGWTTIQENMFNFNSQFWQTPTSEEVRTIPQSGVNVYSCGNSTFQIYYEGTSISRNNRTLLTLDKTYVLSSMPYFPVSFKLENISDNNFWNGVQSDGGDLVITDISGNRLPLDLDYIEKTKRRGLIHFSTSGVLSNATNPQYYLYWGSNTSAVQPSVSSTYGKYNVWDSNYVAVWHFGETGTGSVGDFKDSTRYQNNSTNTTNQPSNAPDSLSANFVFGVPKIMSGDYIDIQITSALQQISATNQVTTEVLFNKYYDQYGGESSYQFGSYNGSTPTLAWGDLIAGEQEAEDRINFGVGGLNDNYVADTVHSMSDYYQKNAYGYGRYGSGSLTISAFVAGSVNTWGGETETGKTGTLLAPISFTIGSRTDHSHSSKGWMYELRISKIARPDPWVATSRYMMMSGTNIWSVSSTQSGSYSLPVDSSENLIIANTKTYPFDRKYRCKITLDKNYVYTTESNFPLTFNLSRLSGASTDSILLNPFWKNVQSDGGDIIVTDVNGVRLPLEIDFIDKNSKTGTIHFKNINALYTSASSVNNEFYLYWGTADGTNATQPASSATYGSRNVWDNNYIGVWHLDEISGTSVNDSTQYTNNGSVTGSITTVNSPVGRGLRINSSNYVSVPSQAEFNISAFTLEFLFKTSSVVNDYPMPIALGGSVSARAFHISVQNGGLSYYGMNNDPVIEAPSGSHSNNIWYGGAVRAQLNSSATLYVNTSAIGSDSNVSAMNGNGQTLNIGAAYSTAVFELDEIRLSNIRRSEEWVKTTNVMLANNSTAWSVDKPELVSLSGSISVSPIVSTTYNLSVTNCCGTSTQSLLLTVGRIINNLRKVLKGTFKGILKGVM